MSNLTKAILIATTAHDGQTQINGSPYILHPLHVMLSVGSEVEKIVAVLHDVVEDTDVTLDDLRKAGFSAEIVNAVSALTHAREVSYEAYIDVVACNPLATTVKLADLVHNMDMRRLGRTPTQKDLDRWLKYSTARKLLCKKHEANNE